MKRFETANKTKEELTSALSELRAKVGELHFDRADKKLKDSSMFKKAKKDIARILTALHNA
jgi:ribosomal protein L29